MISRLMRNLKIRYKLLISYCISFALCITAGSVAIYYLVKTNIEASIESELQNSTNMILTLVRTAADVSVKNYLRATVDMNIEVVNSIYKKNKSENGSEEIAKKEAADYILMQQIAQTGYLYAIDSGGRVTFHPNPSNIGVDYSDFEFVRKMKREKNGYMEYDWKNPGELAARPKAQYIGWFEPWDWIISASSYRSEFLDLVNVEDFRESILSLKFGETGYTCIIDSEANVVVHPFITGNMLNVVDERYGKFTRIIIERKNGKIDYPWKNPAEKHSRDKLAIFNYIPEYDWIVVSTTYKNEIFAPLNSIRNILIVISLFIFFLFFLVSVRLSSSITIPLESLTEHFREGIDGRYGGSMPVTSQDEVGQLTRQFNTFMESLRREIQSRMQAEKDVKESRRRLLTLMGNLPGMVYRCLNDRNWTMEFVSEGSLGLTGFSPEELTSGEVAYSDIVRSDFREYVWNRVQQAFDTGSRYQIEYPVITKTGREKWAWEQGAAVVSENGEIVAVEGFIIDFTDRKRAHELMIQSEKMVSVGGLAAGMAHEINNPLGGILQNAQVMKNRINTDVLRNIHTARDCGTTMDAVRSYLDRRQVTDMLDSIMASGLRAARIVENLLVFSRSGDGGFSSCDIQKLMDNTVELAKSDYDLTTKYSLSDVKIIRDYDEKMPPVKCREAMIQQVFLNLLKNGVQAMGDNAGESAAPPCLTLRIYREGETACIEIQDNGPGMDEETCRNILEPFFTTRGVGEGTGLGVSVSYFIITENHDGTMDIESSPGKGTKIIIRLPF